VSSSRIRAAIGEEDADEECLNRHRHLLNDIASLLPHSRKDAKLDTKSKLYQLNELAEKAKIYIYG